MELWYPPNDRPHLFEWWRPLVLASRAARLERFPWPLHVDEMVLVGRIDRASRPSIWVYRHDESRHELYLDATGQAYKFTRTPNAKGYGRFNPCEIRTALWRAGIPDVVEPIWFADEVRPRIDNDWADPATEPEPEPAPEPASQPEAAPAPRRHGHLTVHDGGRPLAG